MAKNLMGWMLPLTKQGCCKAVAAAMHKYDRSRYGTIKPDEIDILPHEDALAALRVAARKTGKRKFRTALSILEGPAVYETRGTKKKTKKKRRR